MAKRLNLSGADWDALLAECERSLSGEPGCEPDLLEQLVAAVKAPVRELAEEVPELMGAKEVAECLGVKVPNIPKDRLPDPQQLACGPVWGAAQVRQVRAELEQERAQREQRRATKAS